MTTTKKPVRTERSSGILLHPTSLPGQFGIGDLGPAAYTWIDALARARQQWWQILPLGPTGFGDSPYQSFSAFAGNPLLVSPQFLKDDGLITEQDWAGVGFPSDRVDFGPVILFKRHLLDRAWQNFQAGRGPALKPLFDQFLHTEGDWLFEYATFMAIKDSQEGRAWTEWPTELRMRDPKTLEAIRKKHLATIGLYQFQQFLFFRQWEKVRKYASDRGIRIIGDIPIFVAADSADVWANPQFFLLNPDRRPKVVAGVPPDYFSATGQLWGNPLYDWTALRASAYEWWADRLRGVMKLVDIVRLDHFRGFEAYWEVPAGRPDAVVGKWMPGPGEHLLESLHQQLGGLPLIAEDLGIITPEVEALRDHFQLPGMRVLQFAFGGEADNLYLPHNYNHRTVVYTGTHDNDTTRGWYQSAQEKERDHLRRYLGRDGNDVSWDLMRAAWGSVADYAIAPLQDVLDLGSVARMNTPGKAAGNWGWRYIQTPEHVLHRLAEMSALYGRTV